MCVGVLISGIMLAKDKRWYPYAFIVMSLDCHLKFIEDY